MGAAAVMLLEQCWSTRCNGGSDVKSSPLVAAGRDNINVAPARIGIGDNKRHWCWPLCCRY